MCTRSGLSCIELKLFNPYVGQRKFSWAKALVTFVLCLLAAPVIGLLVLLPGEVMANSNRKSIQELRERVVRGSLDLEGLRSLRTGKWKELEWTEKERSLTGGGMSIIVTTPPAGAFSVRDRIGFTCLPDKPCSAGDIETWGAAF